MPRTSPIIFWLLLAATLCVNAVSTYWIFDEGSQASETLFLALAFAQLSVVCVYVVLTHDELGLRWLAPFALGIAVGVIVAVVVAMVPEDDTSEFETLAIFTTLMWIHSAVALFVLWLLKSTRLLRSVAKNSTSTRWQFGVGHLLLAMSGLAILLAVLRQAEPVIESLTDVLTMCVGNSLLLLAVLIAAARVAYWVVRLAISLGTALAIAGMCSFTGIAFAVDLNSYAFNLVQALMLWAWIEVLFASTTPRLALVGEPIEQEAG